MRGLISDGRTRAVVSVGIHGDPFDRMLVAHAIVEDLHIVTGDEAIAAYPVRTIW